MSVGLTDDPAFQEPEEKKAEPESNKKQSASSLLHNSRPHATRYKRSAIIIAASTIALVIAFGFIWAFAVDHHPDASPKEQPRNLIAKSTPPMPDELARDYSDERAYARPGTAELPPTEDETQQFASEASSSGSSGSTGQSNVQPAQLSPAQQRAEKARDEAIKQEMAARTGPILFQGAPLKEPAQERPDTSYPEQQFSQMDMSALPPATPQGQSPSRQNMQDEKTQFIKTASLGNSYIEGGIELPRSRFEIKAGATIAGALLTALNSDLPGEVVATVTENVYDHATGRYVLIPQGARLVGRYDSKVSYKQTRAQVVWNRIIFPNGMSINIGSMTATDGAGAAGLKDRVSNHLGGKVGGVALSSAIAIGAALAEDTGQRDNELVTAGGGALSQDASRVGQEIVRRELDRQPTITVRPGFRVRVLVSRDIVLPPYQRRKFP